MRAVCVVTGEVYGLINFYQDSVTDDFIHIKGKLYNLKRGYHGIHIHEYGDLSNGCTSSGGHFNPDKMVHGGPTDNIRHAGDLGNVMSYGCKETTLVDFYIDRVTLYGEKSVLGRSLVVHADFDDYGRGKNAKSLIDGNSGGRLGCGIIGLAC
ncbi:sod [Adoxophyes orana granulovirus]|uniref:Sod n=1 Tax=Adoxophyes orana granulovirus TaxID=170617 RepID=Q7T9W4_GVAO|nr:sod [Adoxophyes orana granulovirus]AAP85688.1 sod [Adoxophyes orana granulovirus]